LLRKKKSNGAGFLKFVTLNTSLWEQNHHQFNKADDAPCKNIKLSTLLKKQNIKNKHSEYT
jgi:hypothetical protein